MTILDRTHGETANCRQICLPTKKVLCTYTVCAFLYRGTYSNATWCLWFRGFKNLALFQFRESVKLKAPISRKLRKLQNLRFTTHQVPKSLLTFGARYKPISSPQHWECTIYWDDFHALKRKKCAVNSGWAKSHWMLPISATLPRWFNLGKLTHAFYIQRTTTYNNVQQRTTTYVECRRMFQLTLSKSLGCSRHQRKYRMWADFGALGQTLTHPLALMILD